MRKIKRAILSVSDKTGIVDLGNGLSSYGVEIYSSGGTNKALCEADVPAKEISKYTEFPEMLDGRIKTLHPKVHGGILALRANPAHMDKIKEHGIIPFDMIVVNLYPFEAVIAEPGCTYAKAIENIDIGGPTMIRAAAKNSSDVTVITDPADYALVLEAMAKNDGCVPDTINSDLMLKAFDLTAKYDAAIAAYLASHQEKR